jgi:FtsP/CotA-like multicopper oxidase with cupredoxin domain
MDKMNKYLFSLLAALFFLTATVSIDASVIIQCPGDLNGDAIPDPFLLNNNGTPDPNRPNPDYDPCVKCMHLGGGDGFVTMADGHPLYIFGFSDLTGIKDNPATTKDERLDAGLLAAESPAPTIFINEGDRFYLNLTNVGMMMRPDLFDPHTVHWHGFPNSSAVFDGEPDSTTSINPGFSFTYFYNVMEPGTYMYHCHMEATEHMQMGMLGNLYVLPGQDRLPQGTVLGSHVHANAGDADKAPFGDFPGPGDVDINGNGRFDEGAHHKYAYNDGDGSTAYDVDFPIQLGSFDGVYHDDHIAVQPLPFYYMRDNYPFLNGRGYPDTVNPSDLPAPVVPDVATKVSQKMNSLIEASPGQRVLLRISNLNVTRFYTLATLGIPMKIVGYNARLLRSPSGKNLYYTTSSVTTGGGESLDAILEIPASATPGSKYFVYTTNLNFLSNDTDDFGGMMTEIRIKQ